MNSVEIFGLLLAIYCSRAMSDGMALVMGLVCLALQFGALFLKIVTGVEV